MMWNYDFVTREEFERVKDKVEDYIIMTWWKKYFPLNCLIFKEKLRIQEIM